MESLTGKVLAGKYHLKQLLGEGGMGNVYLAEHTGFKEKRAIKIIKAHLAEDEKVHERFLHEVQMTRKAGLQTNHIVSIYDDFGSEDGIYYYVMEYLEGDLLSQRIAQARGTLSLPWIARVTSEICEAMQAAHHCGILFRDLKPDNIFLIKHRYQEDFVKVIDFGIAKVPGQTNHTQAGAISGTPYYMSPEQISGPTPEQHDSNTPHLDPRTDIYSLGCVLYEMLTGQPPFYQPGKTTNLDMLVIFQQHLTATPVPPSQLRKDISPSIDNIVMRALEKAPQRRFSTMSELSEELLLSIAALDDDLLSISDSESTVIQSLPVVSNPSPTHRLTVADNPSPQHRPPLDSGEFLQATPTRLSSILTDQLSAPQTSSSVFPDTPNIQVPQLDEMDLIDIFEFSNTEKTLAMPTLKTQTKPPTTTSNTTNTAQFTETQESDLEPVLSETIDVLTGFSPTLDLPRPPKPPLSKDEPTDDDLHEDDLHEEQTPTPPESSQPIKTAETPRFHNPMEPYPEDSKTPTLPTFHSSIPSTPPTHTTPPNLPTLKEPGYPKQPQKTHKKPHAPQPPKKINYMIYTLMLLSLTLLSLGYWFLSR